VTNNETSAAPAARIRVVAHVSSREVAGVFSLTQEEAASLFPANEGTGATACSTGKIKFAAHR